MTLQIEQEPIENPLAPLRLDRWMEDLTNGQPGRTVPPPHPRGPQTLPEPVFPRHPELLGDGSHFPLVRERRWTAAQVYRKMRGWLFPYIKSRVLPGEFHPIVAYLLTDFRCNVDCNYCPSYNNREPGMTEDIARRTIDWLRSTSCRVLAIMGGEPLVRPAFVHKVVDYAASRGFWIYLGTNGRLLTPLLVDRLGDAGISVVNLAVDVVDRKPGLPKALNEMRPAFEYLLKKQYVYGYMVFLNICICRNNVDDVKQLTEIAHAHGISTDYHICEAPMYRQEHFRHMDDNPNFVRPQDWPMIDGLIDWLVEKHRAGFSMVNPIDRLEEMKAFMRGRVEPWNCRAGRNSVVVRMDGTLSPCSTLVGASYPWGHIGQPRFEQGQLDAMKADCHRNCYSTLQHNLGFCYNDRRVTRWVVAQARQGFRGGARSFE